MSRAKKLLKINEGMDLSDSDISVLLDFAKKYRDLGDAISEQLDDILDSKFEDVNPNAIRELKVLARYHEDIKSSLDEYFSWLKENQ